jgi:hypothetical protein
LIFRNEVSNGAYALSGRIASVMENAVIGSSSAGMLFQTRTAGGSMNNAMYIDPDGKIGFGNTNPTATLDIDGDVHIDYTGTNNGFKVYGSTWDALAYIGNTYAGHAQGLIAGMSSASAGPTSNGILGFNNGAGYGVSGINNYSGTGVYGANNSVYNYGYIGSTSFGVYGRHHSNNYGYLGSSNYSVFGEHNGGNIGFLAGSAYSVYGYHHQSGNSGYLGSSSYGVYGYNVSGNNGYLAGSTYGVYGYHHSGNYGYLGSNSYGIYGDHTSGNYGFIGTVSNAVYGKLITTDPGDYAIYGYGTDSDGEDGISYAPAGTLGGVKGYNFWGNPYTFGVAGYSYLDFGRSGGVIGASYSSTHWGSLGYKNSSSSLYGGYFTSYTSGTGKDDMVAINCGIGAWGDLFGADIHGKIYGAYIEGENYATFANGPVFKNNLDVHLQKNEQAENTVLYTSVSTDVTVQTCGYATLSNGKANITFDKRFSDAVSDTEAVIVTVTPMGKSGSVYLAEVNNNGFSVVENGDGKSNVNLSYIAIGKRKGYENPQLPEEVIAGDYISKLQQGLHNDNDMETDGAGLYYENGQLIVGKHPPTLFVQNKQPEEVPARMKPEIFEPDHNNNYGKAPDPEEK